MTLSRRLLAAAAVLTLSFGLAAHADEGDIRRVFKEKFPSLPKIDEVKATPYPGLFEVRMGTDLVYTDAKGTYILEGTLIDTATQRNLTEERMDKLTSINFSELPLKDAIVWKNGNGKRRIAVFSDPNCGYCKKLERDLVNVKDVTVYTFLVPILGGDSPEKSRAVWCAKDNTAAWRGWMVKGTPPARVMGSCDTAALERNVALAQKHRVTGTPAIVFEDGSRVPGALSPEALEKKLASLKPART